MTSNPSETREELEKLERKHAENPEGRYFVPLANAYRKACQLERAIEVLREGLQKHTDYLSAHIVLGRCLADRDDPAAAEAEFRYVLTLDPQNLIALRTLGELAISDGRIHDAQSWYHELLKVDPMNEDARRALDGMQVIPTVTPEEPRPAGHTIPTRAAPAWEEPEGSATRPAPEESGMNEEPPFAVEGQAVVTETIAELYIRQGFYGRAAEVYRELIRRRGPSMEMDERLRRVEELAAGQPDPDARGAPPAPLTPPVPPPVDAGTPATGGDTAAPIEHRPVEAHPNDLMLGYGEAGWPAASDSEAAREVGLEAGDAFAESFHAGFTPLDEGETVEHDRPFPDAAGTARPAENEIQLAPTHVLPEEPAGESIRDYLATVFSWRPLAGASESAAPLAGPPEEIAPAEPSAPDEFAATAELPELAQPSPPPEPDRPPEPAAAAEPAARAEPPAHATPPAGMMQGSDYEPFPWELPGEEATRERRQEQAEEPTSAAPDLPSLEGVAGARPTEPPAGGPEPAPPPASATEAEDIESFQAWLRSLKR
ncbi:MAG TPA: tetratricopeptide repeat protein [Longimicrobiaceae bacterium]|nr:tetratricopeptide repeat protein [Longimicrobiaceae bacterium]